MNLEFNAWSYEIKLTKPNPKILTKSQKPLKNFPKLKPTSQNAWNVWRKGEKEGLEHLPRDWGLD